MTGTEIELATPSDLATSVATFGHLAAEIARTEFVPKAFRGRPEAVLASMLYGRELGLGPMQSLNMIQSVDGSVGLKPEGMRAVVRQHGHRIWTDEYTDQRVTVCGWRREDPEDVIERVTWTMEDARRAGLANKQVWKNYPRAMMLARATSELCRLHFADVIGGLSYSAEEMEDFPSIPGADRAVPVEVLVDARTAKERLLDAVRQAGFGYDALGRPAVDEARRLWGDRGSNAISEADLDEMLASIGVGGDLAASLSGEGEPAQLTGSEGAPVSSDGEGGLAGEHPGDGETDRGNCESSQVAPPAEPTEHDERPFTDEDRTLDTPNTPVKEWATPKGKPAVDKSGKLTPGATLHKNLAQMRFQPAEHRELIFAATSGRTESADDCSPEELVQVVSLGRQVRAEEMPWDAIVEVNAARRAVIKSLEAMEEQS
jgi:hypothetical protein